MCTILGKPDRNVPFSRVKRAGVMTKLLSHISPLLMNVFNASYLKG